MATCQTQPAWRRVNDRWCLGIVGRRKNGRAPTRPDLTAGVVELKVWRDRLFHRNERGDWYEWSGKSDWTHHPSPPWDPAQLVVQAEVSYSAPSRG